MRFDRITLDLDRGRFPGSREEIRGRFDGTKAQQRECEQYGESGSLHGILPLSGGRAVDPLPACIGDEGKPPEDLGYQATDPGDSGARSGWDKPL